LAERIAEERRRLAAAENQVRECRQKLSRLEAEKSGFTGGFLSSITRRTLPDTTAMLRLQKWNTPTIYNGWEQVTKNPNYGRECFNLEPVMDHNPGMGSLVGLAVTVKIRGGERCEKSRWSSFAQHVASLPAGIPKIIVVQDEDKPLILGSMWGEVAATFFRSLGVTGCIVDGGVRDLDEMAGVGLHAISRGVCVGHAFGVDPLEWDVPVSVFGVTVKPGQLIHADKHGFLVVPEEDETELPDATDFMDDLERRHTIVPGKEGTGMKPQEILEKMEEARVGFGAEKTNKFGSYNSRFNC